VTDATQLFDLTGKVAIVTGSTKGIGRAMAFGLAQARASVVISSRKQDLCEKVASEIEAVSGSTTLGLACHVGDWDAIPGFVASVYERFGHIDVLVNNAGITPTRLTVSDITQDVWQKIFSVNVEGPLRMSQCVAPLMREHGGGSIVNIASMAAYSGGPGVCAYAASKAALVNLTKSMAQEWISWNIRANVLSHGPVPERDGRGRRAERSRLQGHDRKRHVDEASGRPRRGRGAGALPGERCVVVCDR